MKKYKVYTAENAMQGYSQLRSMVKCPFVIILDLMMPISNGWRFLDLQRSDEKFSKIPVIVCSAHENLRSQ